MAPRTCRSPCASASLQQQHRCYYRGPPFSWWVNTKMNQFKWDHRRWRGGKGMQHEEGPHKLRECTINEQNEPKSWTDRQTDWHWHRRTKAAFTALWHSIRPVFSVHACGCSLTTQDSAPWDTTTFAHCVLHFLVGRLGCKATVALFGAALLVRSTTGIEHHRRHH